MFRNIDNSTALKHANAKKTDILDSNQKKVDVNEYSANHMLAKPKQAKLKQTNLKTTISTVNDVDLDSKILAATLNSMGDAVIATNTNSLITRLNLAAEKLTGWTQTEALGHPIDEVFYMINAQTRQPIISTVLETLAEGKILFVCLEKNAGVSAIT